MAISVVLMSRSGSIFISYRRSDSIAETGRIFDRLVSEFGRDHVFKDVDSIPFGVDFAEYLDQAVSQCQVVLVIIGKTWVSVTEPDGTRRLDNPDDFVRIEVESALKRNIPVIPVLLQGVGMPRRPQLPESLQPLARRNGMEVGYDPRFHADMNRLVKGLSAILGETISVADAGAKGTEVSTVYDLRGAQFAGGFAGTVSGDQVGGTINIQLRQNQYLNLPRPKRRGHLYQSRNIPRLKRRGRLQKTWAMTSSWIWSISPRAIF